MSALSQRQHTAGGCADQRGPTGRCGRISAGERCRSRRGVRDVDYGGGAAPSPGLARPVRRPLGNAAFLVRSAKPEHEHAARRRGHDGRQRPLRVRRTRGHLLHRPRLQALARPPVSVADPPLRPRSPRSSPRRTAFAPTQSQLRRRVSRVRARDLRQGFHPPAPLVTIECDHTCAGDGCYHGPPPF